MSMHNWILPRFPDNYRTKRDSNEREYYARLRREWDFCVNESNALHNDLVQLEAPLVDRVSLTLSRQNMHKYEHAVTKKKKKKNNLMILRRSRYHMLQLAKELAATTNRQLTPLERNNVLNYEDYLSIMLVALVFNMQCMYVGDIV